MVRCGASFAVRTEFLNIIETSFGFKGLKLVLCYVTVFEEVEEVPVRFHGTALTYKTYSSVFLHYSDSMPVMKQIIRSI
jgi:hypothetical protein